MTLELHAGGWTAAPAGPVETVPGAGPDERSRPNVSGDLPTVLRAGPLFRRAVSGYDRFQVDTYVRWAEDELAAADREREHLETRHLRTRAALDEARRLLAHSAGGTQFLDVSGRIGSMLAAAADEAESIRAEAEGIRAEAEACRSAASTRSEEMLALAGRALAAADEEARGTVTAAGARAETLIADAARVLDEAERTSRQVQAEAAARLTDAEATAQRIVEDARRSLLRAEEETAAARHRTRAEIVGMLDAGREQRRRADEEAAAIRDLAARDAATSLTAVRTEVKALRRRRSSLRSEIRSLERRRSALQPEAGPPAGPPAAPLHPPIDGGLLPRLRSWSRRLVPSAAPASTP